MYFIVPLVLGVAVALLHTIILRKDTSATVSAAMVLMRHAGLRLRGGVLERCDGKYVEDATVVKAFQRLLAVGRKWDPDGARAVEDQVFPQDELQRWNRT